MKESILRHTSLKRLHDKINGIVTYNMKGGEKGLKYGKVYIISWKFWGSVYNRTEKDKLIGGS